MAVVVVVVEGGVSDSEMDKQMQKVYVGIKVTGHPVHYLHKLHQKRYWFAAEFYRYPICTSMNCRNLGRDWLQEQTT